MKNGQRCSVAGFEDGESVHKPRNVCDLEKMEKGFPLESVERNPALNTLTLATENTLLGS